MSQPIQLVGLNCRKERTGATTLTARWAAPNYNQALFETAPRQLNNLDLVSVEVQQDESGQMFITTGIYEGGEATAGLGGGGSSGNPSEAGTVYEWSPSFEQVDILTHPKIGDLLKKYQGSIDPETGTIRWEEELTNSPAGGLSGDEEQKSTKNPMLGVREYLVMGGVWSRKSLQTSVSSLLFANVGKIVTSVPGLNVSLNTRFWLTMPPVVVSRGEKWEITERWLLSGTSGARSAEAARAIYETAT